MELEFHGAPPEAADLARRWQEMLGTARLVVDRLPPAEAGRCVLDHAGRLFGGEPSRLEEALARGELAYHAGSIRGAVPRLKPS
jgi:hypothetical protein